MRRRSASVYTGNRFGRLEVVEPGSGSVNKVMCRCDCGASKAVSIGNLLGNQIISCGCLRREQIRKMSTTHGMRKSPEHSTWCAMKARCYNPKSSRYAYYGGRGIKICDEWRNSFESFFAYIGPKPSPSHSIDRYPNNDGNYEPGNVRWASAAEQSVNKRQRHTPLNQAQKDALSRAHKGAKRSDETKRRMSVARTGYIYKSSRVIEYNGERKCASAWARDLNMTYGKLISRIYNGWPIPQALGFEPRSRQEPTNA